MTGKQLKNSILQWTIQGKLVPQDPNDEPASVLLEKIRQEKERLIKEKKIKRDKNESIIYRGEDNSYYEKFLATGEVKCIDEEIPFEIPQGWEWCRLSGAVNIIMGQSPNGNDVFEANEVDNAYEFHQGKICFTDKYIAPAGKWCKEPSRIANIGSLLVCVRAPIGDVNITQRQIGIGRGLAAINGYNGIKSDFLFYWLLAHKKMLVDKGTGSTFKAITVEVLKDLIIPIPPLSEQQRIVSKLEEILSFVEHYEQLHNEINSLNAVIYEQLRKSILQEAIQGKLVPQIAEEGTAQELYEQVKAEKQKLVKEGKLKETALSDSVIYKGDDNKYFEKKGNDIVCIDEEIPFDIPNTWEWVRLSDVVQVNPKNDVPDNTLAAFIPMERIDATYLSSFTYSERKWGDIKAGFTHFADGDVAFAKITPCFQNRKSMILKGLPNGVGAGTTELKVLRTYAETIDREYLLFFLESSYFVEEAIFKGTANQQRIISGYLETKLFPLPPLSEQRRISEKIKELYKLIGQ